MLTDKIAMEKIDIYISFAPHEILSITDVIPHPMFHNVYYTYTRAFFTLLMPFKDFVFMSAIPSYYFVPANEKKDLPLGCIYDYETTTESPTIIGHFPPYIVSKFGIEIISAEETANYDNLIPAIYFKNIFFHIAPKRINVFIFIPNTEYAIRIKVDNELSKPNYKGINALIEANKSNIAKRYPPFVQTDNHPKYPALRMV